MPEAIVLLLALVVAGVAVMRPLWTIALEDAPSADQDGPAIRYRAALEALRDVEADRRAGSLDDDAYAEQLAEAEARAARARAALGTSTPLPRPTNRRARRAAVVAAGLIGVVLLGGWFVPATGIANRTEINESLAAAEAAEAERQQRIGELRASLAQDPTDPETLSALADAHLEGSSQDDLVRAAVALQLLLELEPDRADAYERIIVAYVRADDYANARAAHDAYAGVDTADAAEVAFLDGIIALRGENDLDRARAAFDDFLSVAPDDPRAAMVRALLEEAAGP